jgi:hypothetical protein
MVQASVQTRAASRYTNAVTGHRFLLLFLFLLSNLILYPYIDHTGFRYYVFRVLGSAVIFLSIYAVSFRRSLVLFALLLAAPAMVQRVVFLHVEASALSLFNTSCGFVFDVFVVVVIFRHVFAYERPNSETIFGALCIYLLIGFSFASLYEMISAVQPGAFYLDPLTNLHKVPDRFDCVYYSFGSMTALGTSGITPVSNQARSLSVIEAILGILYLAVLISRLMAAYRIRNDR